MTTTGASPEPSEAKADPTLGAPTSTPIYDALLHEFASSARAGTRVAQAGQGREPVVQEPA